VDDDVVALVPVDGGGNTVLVAGLEGVDHAEDLVEVAARLRGVGQGQADNLLGVDHEHRPDGEGDALGVNVCGVHSVQHVVQGSDPAIEVGDDRELNIGLRARGLAAKVVDVRDPLVVGFEGIGRKADDLDTTLVKLGLLARYLAELGGADGGEVGRVGEEDGPRGADPLVELDRALRRLSLKVGRDAAKSESGHDD